MKINFDWDFREFPDGWVTTVHRTDSGKVCEVHYATPVYTGLIAWDYNQWWGDVASRFEHEGEMLHSCDGHSIHEVLGLPVKFCEVAGKDGWQKLCSRGGFEQWLKTFLPAEELG